MKIKKIPLWLEQLPSSRVSPPVETQKQELPFKELGWKNFERLCLRVVRQEANVEHCQLYGEEGQNQEGIDLYARKSKSDKYTVYQCKRQKNFGPKKIETAVTKFLEGEWVSKTETFVLCTMESLIGKQRADKIEEQNLLLKKKGIKLIPWDCHHLSTKLKILPEIVIDFFGEIWAKSFCSDMQLNDENFKPVKRKYCEWISKTSATFNIAGLDIALPISKAWLNLSVLSKENFNNEIKGKQTLEKLIENYHEWERLSEYNRDIDSKSAEYITSFNNRVVVVGGPGSGKSTLLKRLAHKYANTNKIVFWVRLTQIIHQMEKSGCSFDDALIQTSFDGSGISYKTLEKFFPNPDYFFADGLDECDPKRSEIIASLIKWSFGHKETKIIITTRPVGHDVGSFSGWRHYEILPIQKSDISTYSRQIIEELFLPDTEKIKNEINTFNEHLKINKTASMAARNPLLLGFLIQLSVNNLEFGKKRASLYKQIIRCIQYYPPQDRKTETVPKNIVFSRTFEIFGWILQNEPSISCSELLKKSGDFLKDELDCSFLKALENTEQALDFWIERRLMEKVSFGGNSFAFFIHMTLCEYAAARYVISQNREFILQWLKRTNAKSKWRETILLAAGVKGGECILELLLTLEDPMDFVSNEILLAASALSEIEHPGKDLIEPIANALLLKLTSNIRRVVLETGFAALKLTQFVPETIGPVAQSLIEHPQPWTRFAAWNLAIHSGAQYYNLDLLEDQFDVIFNLM